VVNIELEFGAVISWWLQELGPRVNIFEFEQALLKKILLREMFFMVVCGEHALVGPSCQKTLFQALEAMVANQSYFILKSSVLSSSMYSRNYLSLILTLILNENQMGCLLFP